MAQGYGYGLVDEKGFVGSEREFDQGAWKDVDTKRLEGADGMLTRALDAVPVLGLCKVRLRGAIRALVQALAGQSESGAADATWDKLQERLDAQVALQETDDDEEVAAAARRLRGALLTGVGTGQIHFKYRDEVSFGRTQVRLAAEAPLADDVARCGLAPTLKRIDAATEALADAIGQGDAGGRAQPRSLQVRAALNGCVAAFNGVHDDLTWLLAHTAAGADRDTVEALLAPLRMLLDDHREPPAVPAKAAPLTPADAGIAILGDG